MSNVYSEGYCTISASDSSDGTGGCFIDREGSAIYKVECGWDLKEKQKSIWPRLASILPFKANENHLRLEPSPRTISKYILTSRHLRKRFAVHYLLGPGHYKKENSLLESFTAQNIGCFRNAEGASPSSRPPSSPPYSTCSRKQVLIKYSLSHGRAAPSLRPRIKLSRNSACRLMIT